jgi:hypothetical protein
VTHRFPRAASPLALLVALLAALVLAAPRPAEAGTITAGETRIETEDPRSISFRVSIEAEAGLESVRFNYKVLNPDGNVGGSGVAEFAAGNQTDATFSLETNDGTRYIPVGSEFAIQWQLTDGDGDTVLTEEERFIFLDGRYDWQSRTEDDVTVYWYGDNEDNALLAFAATRSSLDETGALLGVDVPYPVKVVVWRSEDEGNLAMQPRGATFDAQVLTGGQRVAPDLIFVFEPDVDVIRHETAHIVTKVAGDGPFTRVPAWLDEGTAVYMQNNPGQGYSTAVSFAVQTNAALNLRSLQSPANEASLVNLFYGQSWSTVRFLIDEFGEDQFAELYAIIQAGSTTDAALEAVYGVNQDGLYNLWREDNGLPLIEFGERGGGATAPGVEATRAPLSIPTSVAAAPRSGPSAATPSGGDAGGAGSGDGASEAGDTAEAGGSSSAAGLAVAIVTLVIVGVLGGGAFALLRRKSAA